MLFIQAIASTPRAPRQIPLPRGGRFEGVLPAAALYSEEALLAAQQRDAQPQNKKHFNTLPTPYPDCNVGGDLPAVALHRELALLAA
jgi:hypothetical protein